MVLHQEHATLCIENHEDNLKIRNFAESDDSAPRFLCKLNDLFCNNFDFEMSNVTVLQLDNCDISEIPNSIQKLNLKQLILRRNKLEEIPKCIYSGLKSLELLDLSQNLIKEFDIEPACSCSIVTLKLSGNKIKNFPYWILHLQCPRLLEVDYSRNCINDLRCSHDLQLKKLEMRNSQLISKDFVFIKKIKTLEFIDISNDKSGKNENRFENLSDLFTKNKWRKLQTLVLNNLVLSIVPKEIFKVFSIKELCMVDCHLNWIPHEIEELVNLEILDVSNNSICSLPKELTSLKKLSTVKAPFNLISFVCEFETLKILDLYNNQLEVFPDFIDRVAFIDLEGNYFDTYNHEGYKIKRDNLRKMFDYSRIDGPFEAPESPSYSFVGNISDESVQSSIEYQDISIESECWDEQVEEPPEVFFEKHPEITSSDDEWDGREEIKVKPKAILKIPWLDENEDWIFCDAEEDES